MPLVIPPADGFQRVRVHLVAAPVLLGHEQAPAVPHRGGVGDGAVLALDAGIVGEGVAIAAEQRAARLLFREVALGLDILDVEIDRAVLESEARDHAVVVERDVVLEHRRVGIVGHGAEEGALDLGGDIALDRQVAQRVFSVRRGVLLPMK